MKEKPIQDGYQDGQKILPQAPGTEFRYRVVHTYPMLSL